MPRPQCTYASVMSETSSAGTSFRFDTPGWQRRFAASGVIVEWYDFTLFAFMTPTLAPLFFPNSTPAVAMISLFGVFAAGYLVRPLGGIVLGRIGDRQGRRRALLLATILMLIPLLGITLVPTYAAIGILAPVLLTIFRLIQGFSVGGEYSGALATLSETGAASQRGRSVASGLATAIAGLLLASLTAAATSLIWGEQSLAEGTWRIPFAFGFLLCLAAYIVQRRMHETADFVQSESTVQVDTRTPVRVLFSDYRIPLLTMFLLGLWSAVTVYTVLIWLPSFMATRGELSQQSSLLVASLMSGLYIVAVFPVAKLGDRCGRSRIMLMTAGAYIVLAIPLFAVIDEAVALVCVLAALTLVILQTFVDANAVPAMTELVPSTVRFTGLALSYNIAMIVGGFTPLIATSITAATGNDLAAAGILVVVAVVMIPVILAVRRKQQFT